MSKKSIYLWQGFRPGGVVLQCYASSATAAAAEMGVPVKNVRLAGATASPRNKVKRGATTKRRRAWPKVNTALAVYYAVRMHWPTKTMAAHDAAVSSATSAGCPKLLAYICDIGAALDQSLTTRQADLLDRRWYQWFMAQSDAGMQTSEQRRSQRMIKDRPEYQIAKGVERARKWDREARERELKSIERRKDFQALMSALECELAARDLFARAITAERCRISIPAAWVP